MNNTRFLEKQAAVADQEESLYSAGESWLMVGGYYIVGIPALILSLLIYWAIYKNDCFHKTGYALLISENVSEGLCLLSTIVAKAFLVLRYVPIVPPPEFLHITAHLLHIAYHAMVFHLNLVAVNRFCAVVLYKQYKRIFTRRVTSACICVCWLYGIAVDVGMYAVGIRVQHEPVNILLVYNGDDVTVGGFFRFDFIMTIITVTLPSLLYIAIVIELRRMKNRVGQNQGNTVVKKEDIRLSFCFMAIIMLFAFAYIFYSIIHWYQDTRIKQNDAESAKWMRYVYKMAYVVNYSANAYILLLLNSRLRKKVFELFQRAPAA